MSDAKTPAPTALELQTLAAQIEAQDYFARLGVDQDATPQAIQRAYLTLAKRWHPDRLPASLATEGTACARVFAALTEAQRTLTDASARAEYVANLAAAREGVVTRAPAADLLAGTVAAQRAYACHARGDIAGAERLCRQACATDPSLAEGRALLAWIEATRPEATDEDRRTAVIELGAVLALSPTCVRALHFRALLSSRLGDYGSARRDLARMLTIDSRNVDALRELRRAELVRVDTTRTPSGIFARLFCRKRAGT